jgi:hypothetical protein
MLSAVVEFLSKQMDLLCNTMLFVQPKYRDEEYTPQSSQIKKDVAAFLEKLDGKQGKAAQDVEIVRFLSKLLEILDKNAGLRQNLIRFRNELELYKRVLENETRARMIELAIQVVNVLHYGTFYCFNFKTYDERVEKIKLEFEYFKDLIHTSPLLVTPVDKFFLGVLYKIPKLMKIKLGYKKVKRESKINEELE